MSRQFTGYIPPTDASVFSESQPLSIGDNVNYWIGVSFTSDVPVPVPNLAWTAAGTGPFTIEVTAPDTTDFPGTGVISASTDTGLNGAATITVTAPTTFTFSDAGAAKSAAGIPWVASGNGPNFLITSTVASTVGYPLAGTVSAATDANLNGPQTLTLASPTTFTFTDTGGAKSFTAAPWVRSGPGPFTITVTVASTVGLPLTGTVSNGSNPAVDGAQTITKASGTTFTFSLVADPGASGTLDYAYTGVSPSGTLTMGYTGVDATGTLTFTYLGADIEGDLALEAAFTSDGPWFVIDGSTKAISAATGHAWNVSDAHYPYVRVTWDYDTGVGAISATANINEQMISKGA